jgi:hypothetical protein
VSCERDKGRPGCTSASRVVSSSLLLADVLVGQSSLTSALVGVGGVFWRTRGLRSSKFRSSALRPVVRRCLVRIVRRRRRLLSLQKFLCMPFPGQITKHRKASWLKSRTEVADDPGRGSYCGNPPDRGREAAGRGGVCWVLLWKAKKRGVGL